MTRAQLVRDLRAFNTCGLMPGVDARMAQAADMIEAAAPPGWRFFCDGDEVTILAPNGGPSFRHLRKGGSREARTLHALTRALVKALRT